MTVPHSSWPRPHQPSPPFVMAGLDPAIPCARVCGRVYAYLAEKLGLPREAVHTGLFDLETCRRAWLALKGVNYPTIREWAKARKEAA